MAKRILIATDGSPASLAAVKYMAFVFGKGANINIDLLHILPGIYPLFLEPGESMEEMAQLQDFAQQMGEENRRKADSILEEAKTVLVDAGMDPANINTRVQEASVGVARDILEVEATGEYDGIVLGRHGMSAVGEFFVGSVSHKVLQHTNRVPLCIVHNEVESRRILLPIESAPNSKRALDHAAWLLTTAGPMEVTILHVVMPLIPKEATAMWTGLGDLESTIEQRLLADAEDMLSQAKTYLVERDVPDIAVTTRLETRATGVSRAILKEAEEGGYGSIMIGRRGLSRTERFLFGSVSNKVIHQARGMAVWVIC
ncbi:MAG: universal stress protein [Deltaproteobacteria bacterium]|nr:universal stress protein [Deltaproteobacteria bacterium]